MPELDRVAQDFEDGLARAMKPGDPHTVVSISPYGVHVNNPPKDSGFVHGQDVSSEDFIRLAKAWMDRS